MPQLHIFKKYFFFLFLNLFLGQLLFAQQKNELINSGELIEAGSKLHDKGEYKKAIELYSKINRSDTNYSDALYELSLSSFGDKQYEKAISYAELGTKLFPAEYSRFTIQQANALDELKKTDESIKLYNKALEVNPQSYILHFNRGVTFLKLENYVEARQSLQNCLLINPYYASAHYFIGSIYLKEGNLIPAMLAFKTYLLFSPSGKYANNCLTALNAIAKVNDEVLAAVKNKKSTKEDNFDMLQQIVLSKIALDNQYKLRIKLEDKILRQIQVVDEKLEFKSNDKGFAMQFYVPLYVDLFKDDFEAMLYTLISGVEIADATSWRKKNAKAIEKMSTRAVVYLNEIRNTRTLQFNDRASASVKYYYENGNYLGKGFYKNVNNKIITTGDWEFYYSSGILKTKGTYNAEGNRTGEWLYYHENGKLKEKDRFVNDILDGPTEAWFTNGNPNYKGLYDKGNLTGLLTKYYYNGLLLRKSYFKSNNKEGPEEEYFSDGFLSYKANYANDKKEGLVTYFYNNGQKKDELNYKNDKREGHYKSYYKSGKLEDEGDFINDKKEGLWSVFYENGNAKEKTIYKEGEIMGEFTEYYESGKLSRKGNYNRKKIDGKLIYYDEDGIVSSDEEYDKGKLREINFYDKKGNVISNTSTRKGAGDITFFSAQGIKTSQGHFNRDGSKDGEHVSFYSSGVVSEKSIFKDGLKEGAHSSYYTNGKQEVVNNFTDDEEDGLSKGYYSNGKLNYEGWVIKGQKQQEIIFHNQKGDIKSKNYYLNDELDGYSEYYYPGNIKDVDYRYHLGWLEGVTQFDTAGNVLCDVTLDKGKGAILFKHNNGKKYVECNYEHYEINGLYKSYYFDGTPQIINYYKNGTKDSIYKSFFYGGKLQMEGKYILGQKQGKWKYYYTNGKIKEEENYEDGKLSGENKFYRRDGSLEKVSVYKKNNLEGPYKYYADKDQLAFILNYKNEELQSYTYEDKTGKLLEPIILKGSTGKVAAFFKNGIASAIINYVNNEAIGARKLFYSNGTPYIDGTKEVGFDNGVKKAYYPNGKIEFEENFELGNLTSVRKTYYPSGALESEENYYDSSPHGISKYFDETGKLIQTRKYFHNNLLSIK